MTETSTNSTTKLDFSIMIPIYNEEDCIENTVTDLTTEFNKLNKKYNLVLMDNGSVDSTPQIVDKIKTKYPSIIKVVHLKKNIGYGGCINLGLKKFTKAGIIGWTCADAEVTAEDTRKCVDFILNNSDYGISKAWRVKDPGYRKFISYWYGELVNLSFSLRIQDINGWPFLIRSDLFNSLDIELKNWLINVELLYKLRKRKQLIKEVKCKQQQRAGGYSKVSVFTIVVMAYQLFSYRLKTVFGKRFV